MTRRTIRRARTATALLTAAAAVAAYSAGTSPASAAPTYALHSRALEFCSILYLHTSYINLFKT